MAKTFIYENDEMEIHAIYKEGELTEDDIKELKRQVKIILERSKANTLQKE